MSKGFVNILCRVYPQTAYDQERVELEVSELVRNPQFPQALGTEMKFRPTMLNKEKGKKPNHMKKSTLDYLLLTQGKAIRFLENEKVKLITLDKMPAEFLKGKKENGDPYYLIKVDLSVKAGETHNRYFFADDMSALACQDFVTQHVFDVNEKKIEEEIALEETEEDSE